MDCVEQPISWAGKFLRGLPFSSAVLQLTPDTLQTLACGPTNIQGDRTYVITARAGKIDMSAGGGLSKALSACFDACDDFVCEVSIGMVPPPELMKKNEGE